MLTWMNNTQKLKSTNKASSKIENYLHIVLNEIFNGAKLINNICSHQFHGGFALERSNGIVEPQVKCVNLTFGRFCACSCSAALISPLPNPWIIPCLIVKLQQRQGKFTRQQLFTGTSAGDRPQKGHALSLS